MTSLRTRVLALASTFAIAACSSGDDAPLGLSLDSVLADGMVTTASLCRGTLGADEVEKVYVPQGATCTLNGTRVQGDVKVMRGATLIAVGADVEGNVQAEDAAAITLSADTRVDGDVQVKRRAAVVITDTEIGGNLQVEERDASLQTSSTRIEGDLQVSKAGAVTVMGLYVRGDLQVVESGGAIAISDTDVLSNLQLFKNRAGVQLLDNRISQSLQCNENSPAPTGTGNVAGEKEEQCAAV